MRLPTGNNSAIQDILGKPEAVLPYGCFPTGNSQNAPKHTSIEPISSYRNYHKK